MKFIISYVDILHVNKGASPSLAVTERPEWPREYSMYIQLRFFFLWSPRVSVCKLSSDVSDPFGYGVANVVA